ncbi:MAG: hypothetical protein L3J16_03770 [Anaerolineales bacterium]|nr:hypothetical protein [Anaerolineales bacterium]
MLIIISDVHLGDGTCGQSISSSAFRLFAARLQELAYNASWRTDGKYRPLREINIIWLGDILDPLHSTRWLDTSLGADGYVRPWTDWSKPEFASKLREITRAIIKTNRHAADAIRSITRERAILLPPPIGDGQPDPTSTEKIQVKVNIYYMVGNHDWFYHLPGEQFDSIRQEVIDAFGLASDSAPFPHEIEESPLLTELVAPYKVYARHGDIYDSFNFNKDKGRDASSLGDMFTVEVVNRFPMEVARRLSDDLPASVVNNITELTNVRPALASSLWISSQIASNNLSNALQDKVKDIWDEVGDEFLGLQAVRDTNKTFRFDPQDALNAIFRLSKHLSFAKLNALTVWVRRRIWTGELSLAEKALQEKKFIDKTANYIVYGHVHQHEIVPLDLVSTTPGHNSQIYINSGTWHTYYDLARYKPQAKRFIPYQVLTYLAFYKDDQRNGRRFETWSGAYS